MEPSSSHRYRPIDQNGNVSEATSLYEGCGPQPSTTDVPLSNADIEAKGLDTVAYGLANGALAKAAYNLPLFLEHLPITHNYNPTQISKRRHEIKDAKKDYQRYYEPKALSQHEEENTFNFGIVKYIRHNFKAVDLGLPASFLHYSDTYKTDTPCLSTPGSFIANNNFAAAGIFTSVGPDGKNILHVAFRGTDNSYHELDIPEEKTGLQKFKTFLKFGATAYSDFQAYSDSFTPLRDAVIAYASNPANNIGTIHLTGHSLGAAPVNHWMTDPVFQQLKTPVLGFTFGGVGASKRLGIIVPPILYHTLKQLSIFKAMGTLVDAIKNVFSPKSLAKTKHEPSSIIYRKPQNQTLIQKMGSLFSTLTQGYQTSNQAEFNRIMQEDVGRNITRWESALDLIPKVSSLFYKRIGRRIWMHDNTDLSQNHQCILNPGKKPISRSEKKMTARILDSIKNTVTTSAHDMNRYLLNLEDTLQKEYKTSYRRDGKSSQSTGHRHFNAWMEEQRYVKLKVACATVPHLKDTYIRPEKKWVPLSMRKTDVGVHSAKPSL